MLIKLMRKNNIQIDLSKSVQNIQIIFKNKNFIKYYTIKKSLLLIKLKNKFLFILNKNNIKDEFIYNIIEYN